jgi:hypothetical protein
MNKLYIFALFLFSILVSCKKDSQPVPVPDPGAVITLPDDKVKYEELLKNTGCKVKEAASVIGRVDVFKDTISKTTYLYGSRRSDNKTVFWVSKYTSDGDAIWDITLPSKPEDPSNSAHAYLFNRLEADHFAIIQVFMADQTSIKATRVIIMNSNTGKSDAQLDFGTSTYANMYTLKESFLLYNSQAELNFNLNASRAILQISKTGEILVNKKEIKAIPEKEDISLNDQLFFSKSTFKIASIFGETIWLPPVTAPKPVLLAYEIINNLLLLTYKNEFDLTDSVKYDITAGKIVYQSHNKPVVNITTGEIRTSYTAIDGLTVTLNSFVKSDNGAGTAYYTISYTIKNNTSDKKVIEGTFGMLYENKPDVLQQTGFFSNLLPGESVSRTYQFKEFATEKMSFLKYVPTQIPDRDIKSVIYWKVPL